MSRPRISIRGLMLLVWAFAVSFGLASVLSAGNPFLLIMMIILGLTLHAEIYLLIRLRNRPSPFWKGFLATGVLVLISLFWAQAFPRVLGISRSTDPATGKVTFQTHVSEASAMATLWDRYSQFATGQFERWPSVFAAIDDSHRLQACASAVFYVIPNLLIPAVGGVLAWAVSLVLHRRRVAMNAA